MLSRQIEIDEGYRSSRAGVSGCFTRCPVAPPSIVLRVAAAAGVEGPRTREVHRPAQDRPRLRRMGTAF
jgi:hypothetical protein